MQRFSGVASFAGAGAGAGAGEDTNMRCRGGITMPQSFTVHNHSPTRAAGDTASSFAVEVPRYLQRGDWRFMTLSRIEVPRMTAAVGPHDGFAFQGPLWRTAPTTLRLITTATVGASAVTTSVTMPATMEAATCQGGGAYKLDSGHEAGLGVVWPAARHLVGLSANLASATPSLAATGAVDTVQSSHTTGASGEKAFLFTPPQPATDAAIVFLRALFATQPAVAVHIAAESDGSVTLRRGRDGMASVAVVVTGDGAQEWFGLATGSQFALMVDNTVALRHLAHQRAQLAPGTVDTAVLTAEMSAIGGLLLLAPITAGLTVSDSTGVDFTVDLAAGIFTVPQLTASLQAAMDVARTDAASTDTSHEGTLSFTQDTETGRVTLACSTGASFRLQWAAGAESVANALGFPMDSGFVRSLASERDLLVAPHLHWDCHLEAASQRLRANLLVNVPMRLTPAAVVATSTQTTVSPSTTWRGSATYHHGYTDGSPVLVSCFSTGQMVQYSAVTVDSGLGTQLQLQLAPGTETVLNAATSVEVTPFAETESAAVHFVHGEGVRKPSFGRLLHAVVGLDPHLPWAAQHFTGGLLPHAMQPSPPHNMVITVSEGDMTHSVKVGRRVQRIMAEVTLNGLNSQALVRGHGNGAALDVAALTGFRVEFLHADTLALAELDGLSVYLTFTVSRD